MKKTVVLSILMAILLAASMSFSCFATESTNYYISTSKDILCNYTYITLGTVNRYCSYDSTSQELYYNVGISADYVDATNKANVKFSLTSGRLNLDYSSVLIQYVFSGTTYSFDQYVVENIRSIGFYTTTETYNGPFTTTNYNHYNTINSIDQTKLYAVTITGSGYYKSIYNGSMTFDTAFCCVSSGTDYHYYY